MGPISWEEMDIRCRAHGVGRFTDRNGGSTEAAVVRVGSL
jgi:hypothetical protein